MRWADPEIKLVASAISLWESNIVERVSLLLEQAAEAIDYLSIHWYVGNPGGDLPAYLATSELIEERLGIVEGLSAALTQRHQPLEPIPVAVDEWNVWYKATPDPRDPAFNGLEETYDLADALVVAMHFNAFFRHARTVKMANLAQLVNVIAPMTATTDGLLLQTTHYPFELYAQTAGPIALDVAWSSDTYSAKRIISNFAARETELEHKGVRKLDVSATLDEDSRRVSVYVVNRDSAGAREVEISLVPPPPKPDVEVHTITGPAAGAVNTFDQRTTVATTVEGRSMDSSSTFGATLPALSVNAFIFHV
jgi:alpha-N-arabinofuranosidase